MDIIITRHHRYGVMDAVPLIRYNGYGLWSTIDRAYHGNGASRIWRTVDTEYHECSPYEYCIMDTDGIMDTNCIMDMVP